MTNRSASIIPHLREHKPRTIPTHHLVPSHPISAAPCAIPQPLPEAEADVAQPSRHALTTPQPQYASSYELRSSSPARSVIHGPPPISPITPNSVTKTRKRFRKKANGLFGDQTELKKRMSKLITKADSSKLVRPVVTNLKNSHSRTQRSFQSLPAARAIIKHLTATISSLAHDPSLTAGGASVSRDSLEFIKLDETAIAAVGSLEKLDVLRNSMGKLTPLSTEQFLSTLGVGRSPRDIKKPFERDLIQGIGQRITPPSRPPPDPEGLQQTPKIEIAPPKSVDRTGLPAVLRCKTRRVDRGYRRADVLRARLRWTAGTEATTPSSATSAAAAHHDTLLERTRTISSERTPPREPPIQNDEKRKGSFNDRVMLIDVESQHQETGSVEQELESHHQEISPRIRKRRRAAREDSRSGTAETESHDRHSQYRERFDTSSFTKRRRPSRPDLEKHDPDDVSEAHNALKILVEAATGRTGAHREINHPEQPVIGTGDDNDELASIEKAKNASELDTHNTHEHQELTQKCKRCQLPKSHRKRMRDKSSEDHARIWQGEDLSETVSNANECTDKRRRKRE